MTSDTPLYDLLPVPAAAFKNRGPICEVLGHVLPKAGTVLEVGSGSGAHVAYLASHLPHPTFQPTERLAEQLVKTKDWIAQTGLPNIAAPLKLDLLDEKWPVTKADALIAINVIHIAPWAATVALIRNGARILPSGAPLYFYGPFYQSGVETAASNIAFDQSLREEDPAKGLRDLDEIIAHAHDAGFSDPRIIPMPANNLSVVFSKG